MRMLSPNSLLAFVASALTLTAASAVHAGPYAPAAGKAGSTAISKDSTLITHWATGYRDYLPGTDVDAIWQTPDKALGKAVGDSFDVVVLGNGGSITLTFDGYITNGAGADFAVFENSFSDTFLELAWVEVSSNGIDFFRFANTSLTSKPVTAFGSVDPTNIDGLAGKYKQGWGTPFDLDVLAGTAGLDIDKVQYVRIVDIVGDGSARDSAGRIIYDPHKTVGSGGFDLDAIGVMNHAAIAAVPEPSALALVGVGLGIVALSRRRRQA
ncbi:MAG: PEP-CTERM sorting domain-containing protein [Aquabacterium sp.]|jgi:hypothetical protein